MDALEKTTHEWIKIQENVFYRKFKISLFPEPMKKLNFSNCHIAVAKNGGLMAFIKKSKHLIMESNNLIKDNVLIYYQNGIKDVDPIKVDFNETIILFEFTEDEDLICLLSDGRLYKFDINLLSYDFDFLGLTFADNNIIDARLFNRGLILLTENGDFYINYNINDPNSILFFSTKKYIPEFTYYNFVSNISTTELKGNVNPNAQNIKNNELFYPSDFCIISDIYSSSGRNELIFPHPKGGIILYIENDNIVRYIKKNIQKEYNKLSLNDIQEEDDLKKIIKICISPSGSLISFYNIEKKLFVFSTQLTPESMSISSMNDIRCKLQNPFQLMWCSDDCIVSYSDGIVGLLGPDNIFECFEVRNNSYLVQEIDGIRIIQDTKVEFFQRVSKEMTESIFPLSFDSSKKLMEAYKLFEENKPNCDAEIRKIKNELPEAIIKILKTATSQWDSFNQTFLLKAAQHGKNFISKEEFSFNYFVMICKELRIINNLRLSEKPRLITYDQYKHIDCSNLIDRLLKTHNFYLAFEIYSYMGLNVKDIYEKWAIAYIKVSL